MWTDGLTFNPKKCKFRVPELQFYGLVFSAEGVKPAPAKVEALKKMSPPRNAAEVHSLLGMAQYSAQFIPRFSEITAPLRMLTHKDSKWKWSSKEQQHYVLKDGYCSCSSLILHCVIVQGKKIQLSTCHDMQFLLLPTKKEHAVAEQLLYIRSSWTQFQNQFP